MKSNYKLGEYVAYGKTRGTNFCPYCRKKVSEGIRIARCPSFAGDWNYKWFHEGCFLKILTDSEDFKPEGYQKNTFEEYEHGRCIVCAEASLPIQRAFIHGIHLNCRNDVINKILEKNNGDVSKIMAELI